MPGSPRRASGSATSRIEPTEDVLGARGAPRARRHAARRTGGRGEERSTASGSRRWSRSRSHCAGSAPSRRRSCAPLAQAVGDLWALGKIPIAAEHLASEVVLHALKGGLRASRGSGPLAVCACLSGERHEWGLLGTLTLVQEQGWRIHYLGPDLPVEELLEAAWRLRPQVVALSTSFPDNCESQLHGAGGAAWPPAAGHHPDHRRRRRGAARHRAPPFRISRRARRIHVRRTRSTPPRSDSASMTAHSVTRSAPPDYRHDPTIPDPAVARS